MKKKDPNIVNERELVEKLNALGYDIDRNFVYYNIPYGEGGYSNKEGILKKGKVSLTSYFNLQWAIKFVKEITEFNLAGKLKELGYDVDNNFIRKMDWNLIDNEFSYDLEKIIKLLEKIKAFDLPGKLKEAGVDADADLLRSIPFNPLIYSDEAPAYDLQKVIELLERIKAFNLPAKLREAGYDVDKIDRDILLSLPFSYDPYYDFRPPYDMESIEEFLNNSSVYPVQETNINQSFKMKNQEKENNYFGANVSNFYGGIVNQQSNFPMLKWYAEKYNTIPDVCYLGHIYVWELLQDYHDKIKWSAKYIAGCEKPESYSFPDMLRTFASEYVIESFTDALIEMEDGMYLLLSSGRFSSKDAIMSATVTLYYKEGLHDPSEIIKFAAENYIEHDDKGTLGLMYTSRNGLDTQDFTIPKPEIDFNLNYNKGFEEVHKTIHTALSQAKGKGLVLLHGRPGTGKTTYIRYLINQLNKNKIFVPPNLTEMLSDPGFIPFLMDNPDCILFVEDAENVLRSREDGHNNQAVSNILNITDGLLSDCLNIQIVATFNTHLQNIDEALLRKGRLIAQYEFKDLEPDRAEKLADSLKVWLDDTRNLTLADIYAAIKKP